MSWKDIFKDEVVKDLISVIKFATPIVVLFFYWGFLENINIGNLRLSMISVVAIIFMWGIDGIRLDWRKRGYERAVEESEELKQLITDIESIQFDESDSDLGELYAEHKTLEAQDRANKIKTSKAVEKLKRQKYNLAKKGKNTESLRKTIKDLEENPMIARPVTPFIYYDIISLDENSDSKGLKDGKALKDNPITYGRTRANLVSLIRYIALGGATAGLVWSQDPIVVAVIIAGYILSAVSTAISQFYFSIRYTVTKHRQHLHDKLNIKKECRTYCNTNKKLLTVESENNGTTVGVNQ